MPHTPHCQQPLAHQLPLLTQEARNAFHPARAKTSSRHGKYRHNGVTGARDTSEEATRYVAWGRPFFAEPSLTERSADLQSQYNQYKNSLQQIAQKIGEIEQEGEEHK